MFVKKARLVKNLQETNYELQRYKDRLNALECLAEAAFGSKGKRLSLYVDEFIKQTSKRNSVGIGTSAPLWSFSAPRPEQITINFTVKEDKDVEKNDSIFNLGGDDSTAEFVLTKYGDK